MAPSYGTIDEGGALHQRSPFLPRKRILALMSIQYVGFNVGATARNYNFLVKDAPGEAREFTVVVQFESFRSTALKFQDGPDLCFTRLKRALEKETEAERAGPSLSIEREDIQEYLERHHPPKRSPAPPVG